MSLLCQQINAHLNGIYQGWGVIATMNGILWSFYPAVLINYQVCWAFLTNSSGQTMPSCYLPGGGGGGGGALPYVGGYQVPDNRPPFIMPTLHPMTPFFHSVHTQWPPFFHFCIKFYIEIANFCALRAHFEKFNDFVAILTENFQILPWYCTFAHWMTPIYGSPHQKSPYFFGAHTEWPAFFDEILHRMPPIFVLW